MCWTANLRIFANIMEKSVPEQRIVARQAYEVEVADQLCAALTTTTGGQILSRQTEYAIGNGLRLDLVLTLSVDDKHVDLPVEILRHAYPRDIREAVWRLGEYAEGNHNGQLIPLVAAESLSPGAKDMLRKRGIGYFELSGSLYLRWRTWLIDIERPGPPSSKKLRSALFTESREMVVHALLINRNKWMTGVELAEQANTSPYTSSTVMQELERREWCESSGAGPTLKRRLIEPRKLLDAWAEHWKTRKEERSRWYTFESRPNQLLTQLTAQIERSAVNTDWAFTGTAAANVYAPLLTSVDTAEIIILPGQTDHFVDALKLKQADKGSNVSLISRTGTSLLFREQHPDFPSWFASPFILYLDLLDGRGRNKELAEYVLEKLEL